MLSTLVSLAFGTTLVNGLAMRGGCQLELTVSGAISGPVGEISSGQVRAGSGIASTTFDLSNGGLTDPQGRGCFFTPPTHVLQCDVGQVPATGFEVACDGTVSFNGQTTFYECQTDQSDEYNIYLSPEQGVNCMEVTLHSDQCHAACPAPPKTCPTNLNGVYEFPHLIIPVDSSKPDTAAGTSFFGDVSGTVSTIFNFDIPAADKGKTCSLVFLFPKQADLVTSSFTFSGAGGIDFASLKSAAMQDTTYNNKPAVEEDYRVTTVSPGNSYLIATFDCPAGETVAYYLSGVGDTSLYYFQDFNPSPIGLYITPNQIFSPLSLEQSAYDLSRVTATRQLHIPEPQCIWDASVRARALYKENSHIRNDRGAIDWMPKAHLSPSRLSPSSSFSLGTSQRPSKIVKAKRSPNFPQTTLPYQPNKKASIDAEIRQQQRQRQLDVPVSPVNWETVGKPPSTPSAVDLLHENGCLQWQIQMSRYLAFIGVAGPYEIGDYLCNIQASGVIIKVYSRTLSLTNGYYWRSLVTGLPAHFVGNQDLCGKPSLGLSGSLKGLSERGRRRTPQPQLVSPDRQAMIRPVVEEMKSPFLTENDPMWF
ncbi:hypothetical protein G7046_g876 [Stylonectria norvegica]|nr:hypothetical protein G7046_g876 [Stylonectria norvegica]